MNAEKLSKTEVVELIDELREASRLYYLSDSDEVSPLNDDEFDAKQSYLQKYVNVYPELFTEGSTGYKILEGDVLLGAEVDEEFDAGEDVVHQSPMLSLQKAKKPEQLNSYLSKMRAAGSDDFRLQAKLDGIAASAVYEDGKLKLFATRGSGTVGKNITYVVDDKNVILEGLPTTVKHTTKTFEVRGEIFMFNSQFAKTNSNRMDYDGSQFEVSRNSVFGVVNRSRKGMPYQAHLTFAVYSLWNENNELMNLEKLDEYDEHFVTVDDLTSQSAPLVKLSGFADDADVHQSIQKFGAVSASFDFPIDGVVIKPVDESSLHMLMGNKSHHPASQIAWKYPTDKFETVIKDIVNTVGKSGRITPVAIFDEVVVDNSKITRASLHNFSLIAKKDVRIGSVAIMEKANEIIPQIVSVVKNPDDSQPVQPPTACPSCHEKLTYVGEEYPPKTLSCDNVLCPARNFESLVFAVGSDYLNIKYMSSSTLEFLHDQGIVDDISDLYILTEEILAGVVVGVKADGSPSVFGEKRAKTIIQNIEKSKTLPLEKILASLGIPLMGRRVSKKLVKEFGGLDAIMSADFHDVVALDGIGDVLARNIVEGFDVRREMIHRMKERGVLFSTDTVQKNTVVTSKNIDDVAAETNNADENVNNLSGLSFAISGAVPQPFAKRNDWVDYLESMGAMFHSSPKNTTDFMIADKNGSSSKIKKALSLGIEFLTAEEFTEKFTS